MLTRLGLLLALSSGLMDQGNVSTKEFTAATRLFGMPTSIVLGPDGAMWFCESNARRIGLVTTGGLIDEYFVISAAAGDLVSVVATDNFPAFYQSYTRYVLAEHL